MPQLISQQAAPAMQELKVGVIGGGFMARTHADAIRRAGAQLIGVRSNGEQSTARAAAVLGVPGFGSVEELLEHCDAVHVTSPNALHAGQAAAALAAGLSVVCEKPLATSARDAGQLALLASRSDAVASVPFVYRYHPMVRQARAHVREGKLGRLLTVRGQYLQDWMHAASHKSWRVDPASGGPSRAFADIGSHLVDLLEFIAGERIVRLSAATSVAHQRRGTVEVATEDAAALVVQMASGAIGTLLVSQVNAGRKNALAIELSGDRSAVEFQQEKPDELWIGGTGMSSTLSRQADGLSPDAARLSVVPAGHPMGYLDAFAAFVADTYAAIRGEAPEGLPTFADGARACRLTEAVLESEATGEWIATND
ncbi:Gfo/Idh/MocA family protein [Glutamicibacter nicotianae]|uniref:Gfo/Idh/MocA family protein n=1 Tax=Glutamicibacter nicotianae TaxID=37929 RepID=UPI003C2C9702